MKKLAILLSIFSATSLFASDVLNVYSSRHYPDVDKMLFEEFTKETGIKVNEVNIKDANALIKKISDEGKASDADVFLAVGIGPLYNAKKAGILQPIKDKKIDANVPKEFRDHQDYWVGLTYRARILAYNPDKVKVSELSTYEALANPKWKGRIVTRTANHEYNQNLLAWMISKNGYNKTKKWATNLVNNFARDPKGNDRDQAAFVVAGNADIAIMNSYYMGRMINDTDPLKREAAKKLKIFFPDQKDGGTHINISGAGIAKYAKDKDSAIKFIEFLTSPKAQQILADYNFEYPVNKKATLNPVVKSWGSFKPSKITFDKIGENLGNATKVAGEANWK